MTQQPSQANGATVAEPTREQAYVAGLRDLADFLEANPDLTPQGDEYFCRFASTAEQLTKGIRAAGGRWEKYLFDEDDEYFKLQRYFGPHRFAVYTTRENVCERVVTSVETVTREVPDPEQVAKLPLVTVTEEVEHVEWVCPPSVLAPVSEDAQS